MERIVVDQCMAPPIRFADIAAMEEQGQWCMQQYRVRHTESLLSIDGQRLVCFFEAPDAEALRGVLRQLDVAYVALWQATVDGPGGALPASPEHALEMDVIAVERSFAEPVELDALQAIEEAAAACLEAHRVRFLRTYFDSGRRRMICLYEAPDAESVRIAQTQAGMPLDRVWPAKLYIAAGQR